jgi:hypothetical protein
LEAANLEGEIQSLTGALTTASEKLEAARKAACRDADETKAKAVLALVGEWDSVVAKLSEAAAVLESQSKELVAIHTKLSGLGAARPTRAQVDAVAGRAWLTTTMATPWQAQFGSRYLAPDERRKFADLADYAKLLRHDAEQRIGKQEEAA